MNPTFRTKSSVFSIIILTTLQLRGAECGMNKIDRIEMPAPESGFPKNSAPDDIF